MGPWRLLALHVDKHILEHELLRRPWVSPFRSNGRIAFPQPVSPSDCHLFLFFLLGVLLWLLYRLKAWIGHRNIKSSSRKCRIIAFWTLNVSLFQLCLNSFTWNPNLGLPCAAIHTHACTFTYTMCVLHQSILYIEKIQIEYYKEKFIESIYVYRKNIYTKTLWREYIKSESIKR